MLRILLGAIASCVILVAASAGQPELPNAGWPRSAGDQRAYGWVDFCYSFKGGCDAPPRPRDVQLTPKTLKEIERINRWVNKNVEATPDLEHWGVVDQGTTVATARAIARITPAEAQAACGTRVSDPGAADDGRQGQSQ